MDIDKLKKWIEKYDVKNEAIASVTDLINVEFRKEPELLNEYFKDYDESLLRIEFNYYGYQYFQDGNEDAIVVGLDVYYPETCKYRYKLVFNLKGEVIDDYMVIADKEATMIRKYDAPEISTDTSTNASCP